MISVWFFVAQFLLLSYGLFVRLLSELDFDRDTTINVS